MYSVFRNFVLDLKVPSPYKKAEGKPSRKVNQQVVEGVKKSETCKINIPKLISTQKNRLLSQTIVKTKHKGFTLFQNIIFIDQVLTNI